ncbi:hypothetical protein SRB5_61000 [Streptomyces sp. RB5]|uniref:Sugar ABC transporter permease n=1 Tax=Streptomyces smaragdinus TaxID=2585196 RepID=A0A7K0CQZ3_9ACTN|nr:ABC transporter permease [Streptomyces smaragdinus]MQY15908.1 hypothetical protein [Streptomyces smaragdinus]
MKNAFKFDRERLLLGIAGPVLALAVAFALSVLVLVASGLDPIEPFQIMFSSLQEQDVQVLIVNQWATYYLAALAVAVGFRMNLFNIGVDGQYRLAAVLAAIVGVKVSAPGPLHILIIILTAIVVGSIWAGVAGVLKTARGVSEVVSTIMLNAIAGNLIAWMVLKDQFGEQAEGSNDLTTGLIDESGWFPGIKVSDFAGEIYGFVFIAAAVGVVYWYVLSRTRFGFDLRASGASESAAAASGVDAKRMVLVSMLISGAVAGLAGMPELLGGTHTYSSNFPVGVGFTGITIALLGRNNPIGVAFAALLIAFLDKASSQLNLEGYPAEIAKIMQGLIVLSVVISYEQVRRYGQRRQQHRVGEELAAQAKKNRKEVSA